MWLKHCVPCSQFRLDAWPLLLNIMGQPHSVAMLALDCSKHQGTQQLQASVHIHTLQHLLIHSQCKRRQRGLGPHMRRYVWLRGKHVGSLNDDDQTLLLHAAMSLTAMLVPVRTQSTSRLVRAWRPSPPSYQGLSSCLHHIWLTRELMGWQP
jgi:hypothetical protein